MPDKKNPKNKEVIKSEDSDGKAVSVAVVKPNSNKIKQAQLAYNKAFRAALESGALLRQKLDNYMREQEIWDDKKEKEYAELLEKINESEKSLAKGGIKLSEAKDVALQMRVDRGEFRDLISERTYLDTNTAEGQADNARFNHLIYLSILDEKTGKPFFESVEDYEEKATEPYAAEAASELARMMYDLDPDYDKNLPENQFLSDYGFVNEDMRLVNKEGQFVTVDGQLVNEEGRLIDEEGNMIDKDGNPLDKDFNYVLDKKPFIDDSGKDIPIPESEEEEEEEKAEAKKEKVSAAKKPTKTKAKTTTEDADSAS
jgi:hypothetical protein